jgi:nucleoid DNA-binding protein
MKLSDFDKDVAKEFGLTQKEAKRLLLYIQRKIFKRISFGESFYIHKVGTLFLRARKGYNYHNLQTGKTDYMPKQYVLDIKVSQTFKKLLRKKTVY